MGLEEGADEMESEWDGGVGVDEVAVDDDEVRFCVNGMLMPSSNVVG